MPWVRLDDQFHAHPKLAGLGSLTLPCVGLHLITLTWCSHYLTDGFVPSGQVRKLGGSKKLTDALVGATLWEEAEGGFRLHDYLDYNPPRSTVMESRAAEAERKRVGRLTQKEGRVQPPSGERPPGQTPESGNRPVVPSLSRPSPSPVPSLSSSSTTTAVPRAREVQSSGRTMTKEELERFDLEWSSFGRIWEPFKEAWTGRGLFRPPSGDPDDDSGTTQRSRLYRIADARPNDLAEWVAEAPGNTAREVIGYIFDKWAGLEEEVAEYEEEVVEKQRTRRMEPVGNIIAGLSVVRNRDDAA